MVTWRELCYEQHGKVHKQKRGSMQKRASFVGVVALACMIALASCGGDGGATGDFLPTNARTTQPETNTSYGGYTGSGGLGSPGTAVPTSVNAGNAVMGTTVSRIEVTAEAEPNTTPTPGAQVAGTTTTEITSPDSAPAEVVPTAGSQ
jgi:hypothetical protein